MSMPKSLPDEVLHEMFHVKQSPDYSYTATFSTVLSRIHTALLQLLQGLPGYARAAHTNHQDRERDHKPPGLRECGSRLIFIASAQLQTPVWRIVL